MNALRLTKFLSVFMASNWNMKNSGKEMEDTSDDDDWDDDSEDKDQDDSEEDESW